MLRHLPSIYSVSLFHHLASWSIERGGFLEFLAKGTKGLVLYIATEGQLIQTPSQQLEARHVRQPGKDSLILGFCIHYQTQVSPFLSFPPSCQKLAARDSLRTKGKRTQSMTLFLCDPLSNHRHKITRIQFLLFITSWPVLSYDLINSETKTNSSASMMPSGLTQLKRRQWGLGVVSTQFALILSP